MLDPQFFALTLADWILIGTSFFASFMAAVAGLGGGVLLLAVMVSFFPPAVVIPLHGVIQLGSNGFRALIMRQFFKQDILLAFTFGSILAAIIGSQVAVSLDETLLKVILGLFILYMVWGPKISPVDMTRKFRFYLGGFISTFASLFIGASGPITAAFMGREKMSKEAKVATHAAVMSIQHGFKIIIFGFLGFAFYDYALLMTLMLLTGMLGTYAGRHMLFKIPESVFQVLSKTVITLLALRLLYSALLA